MSGEAISDLRYKRKFPEADRIKLQKGFMNQLAYAPETEGLE
jgi:hypothetical protein